MVVKGGRRGWSLAAEGIHQQQRARRRHTGRSRILTDQTKAFSS